MAPLLAQSPSFFPTSLFKKHETRIPKSKVFFSLDRITCPDIHRAGDGVHKAFLKSKGFSLNPLHLSYLWLEKRTFKNAKVIIANSELVKDQILEYYPEVLKEKIHIVYNGVPIPENVDKNKAKKSLAQEFNIDSNLPIILFVGSGFERKGGKEFLRIVSKLKNPFHAFVVGKEKRMKSYRELAAKLEITDNVSFTGPRKDVERFYGAADIFLFPTHYEPFSNVMLEAMSYGNIAFTTNQNGAAEILPHAWVMEAPNDISVAREIDRLITDAKALHEGQKRARQIASLYPISRNVEETLELIHRYFG
jgi:UDP-glucose:(heptosyl)LPS alpha-1,3-glucosyltransferase